MAAPGSLLNSLEEIHLPTRPGRNYQFSAGAGVTSLNLLHNCYVSSTNDSCWWLKSGKHQLRLVVYPIIYRVSYILL